jgi:acyl-CoA thioesterase-1
MKGRNRRRRCGAPADLSTRNRSGKIPLPATPSHRTPVLAAALLLLAAILSGTSWGAPADPRRGPVILAFGDSLSAGFGLPAGQGFPAQLERRLRAAGINATVVNAGVSGDTTAGGLARIDWALADKPDLVIVELGANDALRGIDPAAVRANLDAIIARIKTAGAQVLLAGMRAPPNWGEEYQREFDRVYPELARAHGVALYSFFLDGVAMDPGLNQPDGLHPNEDGVAIIADRIAPLVADMIGYGS